MEQARFLFCLISGQTGKNGLAFFTVSQVLAHLGLIKFTLTEAAYSLCDYFWCGTRFHPLFPLVL
jgi:hypothetical protein